MASVESQPWRLDAWTHSSSDEKMTWKDTKSEVKGHSAHTISECGLAKWILGKHSGLDLLF